MNHNYTSDLDNQNYYWLFLSGKANSKNDNIFSKDFIDKITFDKTQQYFWVIAKKDLKQDSKNFVCFQIHDSVGSNPLFIKLEDYSINYSTIKYLILKSNKFSLEC